jgi:hypothetical protein
MSVVSLVPRRVGLVSTLIACCGVAVAADAYPVLAVPAPDRVVVMTKNFPVVLGLAHISVPDDDATRAKAQAKLTELMKGKKCSILYAEGFGTDDMGAAKVQFMIGSDNVNALLVEAGLARFQDGKKPEPALEQPVKAAEAKARKSKSGLWAKGDDAKPAEKPSVVAANKKGPFCSELDTPYYFASDSAEASKLNPQRVIYYPDESTAQRAGKKTKAKAEQGGAITSDGSEAATDAIFAKGTEAYNDALAKGNTPARDEAYEVAYQYLTKAMQDYSALAEKKPNDEALGEKLRKCMQLRYGTVKQRRFH